MSTICQIADYIEALDGSKPEPCLDFATHTISFTMSECISFHYHVCPAHYKSVLTAAKLAERVERVDRVERNVWSVR